MIKQRKILGIDVSTTNLGWVLLEPRRGKWSLTSHGIFKPRALSEKELKEFGTTEDVYRFAADCAAGLCDEYHLNAVNCIAGVERISFLGPNVNTSIMLASISTATSASLWLSGKIVAIPVVPSAWQNFLKAKKEKEGKIAAAKLADEVYDAPGIPQDSCDALGVAHYLAHRRGCLPYIDEKTRKLEIDIKPEIAYSLGRNRIEMARDLHLAESGKDRSWDNGLEAYHEELRNYRKKAGLPAMSNAYIEPFEKADAPA